MATRSQKIKLGIFLAAAGALFLGTVIVFAGLAFISDEETYYVQFSESVSGLEVGAPVKLRGVRVGSVKAIDIDPDEVELVRVEIAVAAGTPIQDDAKAFLMLQGITGLRFVEVQDGTSDADLLPPGSVIPAGESVFARLTGDAEELTLKLEQLLNNLLDMTSALDRQRVEQMLARGEVMAENVDALVVELTQVATETSQLLRENRPHVRSTLANVNRTSDEIARVAAGAGELVAEVDTAAVESAAASLASTLDSFQILVGRVIRLLDHSQGEVRATIYNLRLAAESFKQLAESLQRQPSKLFFGSSVKERELP